MKINKNFQYIVIVAFLLAMFAGGLNNDVVFGELSGNAVGGTLKLNVEEAAAVDVYIGKERQGDDWDYGVASGSTQALSYSLLNGPVKIVSNEPTFTSQRVYNKTQGFVNEITGYPVSKLSQEYWFTWYDNLTMQTWLLIGNPSSTTAANVDVYIGAQGQYHYAYEIPPEGRVTPMYPVLNGPVHIVSDIPVFASERIHTNQGFVNELMGFPAGYLDDEYWFTWYDNLTMQTWLLIGNPSSTTTANVDVYIGAQEQYHYEYEIPAGGRVTPMYPVLNGPVHIVSDIPVFTSQRVHSKATGKFINELMGYPAEKLSSEYWYTWYDDVTTQNWLLIGNPSSTTTANVDVYIGGQLQDSYVILPKGRETPRYGVQNGPVQVVSDIPVFTSQRVHTGQGFVNELMGFPADDLDDEYWFTWYDNLTMDSWILVGSP